MPPNNTVRRELRSSESSALTLGQSSGGCGQWRTPAPQGQYGTPAPWASRPWNRHVRPRALKPKMASARTRRRGGGRRATGPMHTVRTYALVPRHVTPARPCGIFLNSQTLNINCKLARPPCGWCGRRLRSCFSVSVYGVVAGSAPQACRKHGVRELAAPGLAPYASRRESTTSLAPGCKRPASPCPSGRTYMKTLGYPGHDGLPSMMFDSRPPYPFGHKASLCCPQCTRSPTPLLLLLPTTQVCSRPQSLREAPRRRLLALS